MHSTNTLGYQKALNTYIYIIYNIYTYVYMHIIYIYMFVCCNGRKPAHLGEQHIRSHQPIAHLLYVHQHTLAFLQRFPRQLQHRIHQRLALHAQAYVGCQKVLYVLLRGVVCTISHPTHQRFPRQL